MRDLIAVLAQILKAGRNGVHRLLCIAPRPLAYGRAVMSQVDDNGPAAGLLVELLCQSRIEADAVAAAAVHLCGDGLIQVNKLAALPQKGLAALRHCHLGAVQRSRLAGGVGLAVNQNKVDLLSAAAGIIFRILSQRRCRQQAHGHNKGQYTCH